MGDMRKKTGEGRPCGFTGYATGQTDRQTDRQTYAYSVTILIKSAYATARKRVAGVGDDVVPLLMPLLLLLLLLLLHSTTEIELSAAAAAAAACLPATAC